MLLSVDAEEAAARPHLPPPALYDCVLGKAEAV
eukprot:CAMPEP_0115144426 /NCGR_PEP_ID=MMETSP0227-20121206/61490_1 /TAXON_ID=89957 /ORGANISM="Polarella glacialis, Strain CCMP 1383" /LENGTH=32 /DNA_ID= /DNA_START= /DNA_END= /DNA_ORIENTATION=